MVQGNGTSRAGLWLSIATIRRASIWSYRFDILHRVQSADDSRHSGTAWPAWIDILEQKDFRCFKIA